MGMCGTAAGWSCRTADSCGHGTDESWSCRTVGDDRAALLQADSAPLMRMCGTAAGWSCRTVGDNRAALLRADSVAPLMGMCGTAAGWLCRTADSCGLMARGHACTPCALPPPTALMKAGIPAAG